MDTNAEKAVVATNGEADLPMFSTTVGKTTYEVTIYFSQTSKETMTDKVLQLIQSENEKQRKEGF